MDYSLLFAIEYAEEELMNQKKQELENRSKSTLLTSTDSPNDHKQSFGS